MTDAEKKELEQKERDAILTATALSVTLLALFHSKKGADDVDYDSAKGRFFYKGKSVSVTQLRNYLNRIEDGQAKKLDRLTEQLLKGEITIDEWKRAFDQTITTTHILAGALALGGIAVAARNAYVNAVIHEELLFADDFAKAIRRPAYRRAVSENHIRARARSYARKTSHTFANSELEGRKLMGLQTEARRIRRAAESCKDCIWESRKGWMPIEEMPPLGRLRCKHYCRCYIEYR